LVGPSLSVAEPAVACRGWEPLRVTPKLGLGRLQVKAMVRIYRLCSAYGSRLSDRRSRPPCAVETGRPHETAGGRAAHTLVEPGGIEPPSDTLQRQASEAPDSDPPWASHDHFQLRATLHSPRLTTLSGTSTKLVPGRAQQTGARSRNRFRPRGLCAALRRPGRRRRYQSARALIAPARNTSTASAPRATRRTRYAWPRPHTVSVSPSILSMVSSSMAQPEGTMPWSTA